LDIVDTNLRADTSNHGHFGKASPVKQLYNWSYSSLPENVFAI